MADRILTLRELNRATLGRQMLIEREAMPLSATILVDGFVRGAWKIEKTKNTATLVIEPFDKLTSNDRAALIEEGENLIRLAEAKSKSFEVRFAKD
jgi:Winged helix DNA-binding domain